MYIIPGRRDVTFLQFIRAYVCVLVSHYMSTVESNSCKVRPCASICSSHSPFIVRTRKSGLFSPENSSNTDCFRQFYNMYIYSGVYFGKLQLEYYMNI